MLEIPLTSSPEQQFNIILNGVTFNMTVMINSRTGIWSISAESEGQIFIEGMALLSGVNILRPYNFPVTSMYIVNLEDDTKDPKIDDLGEISKLFITEDIQQQEIDRIESFYASV